MFDEGRALETNETNETRKIKALIDVVMGKKDVAMEILLRCESIIVSLIY